MNGHDYDQLYPWAPRSVKPGWGRERRKRAGVDGLGATGYARRGHGLRPPRSRARKLLDPVLERMMEAVHRYEGTVNQVMGAAIMAQFGAPLGHEDHAVRACYAALRMQESVKKYADEVATSMYREMDMRFWLGPCRGRACEART